LDGCRTKAGAPAAGATASSERSGLGLGAAPCARLWPATPYRCIGALDPHLLYRLFCLRLGLYQLVASLDKLLSV
jgi:hypothetical protein